MQLRGTLLLLAVLAMTVAATPTTPLPETDRTMPSNPDRHPVGQNPLTPKQPQTPLIWAGIPRRPFPQVWTHMPVVVKKMTEREMRQRIKDLQDEIAARQTEVTALFEDLDKKKAERRKKKRSGSAVKSSPDSDMSDVKATKFPALAIDPPSLEHVRPSLRNPIRLPVEEPK